MDRGLSVDACMEWNRESARFLIQDGKASGTILIPAGAAPAIRLAADELALHLQKVSGAKLPIADDPGGALPAGSVRLAVAKAGDEISVRDPAKQGFVIDQRGQGLLIEGNSEMGVLWGVYSYLNELGVRWYMRGDLGTYVPAAPSIALSGKQTTDKPAFRTRVLWLDTTPECHLDNSSPEKLMQAQMEDCLWQFRNRLQFRMARPKNGQSYPFPLDLAAKMPEEFDHNIRAPLYAKRITLESHPERYALVVGPNGEKTRPKRAQICFTNRDNIADAVEWSLKEFDRPRS